MILYNSTLKYVNVELQLYNYEDNKKLINRYRFCWGEAILLSVRPGQKPQCAVPHFS